MPDGTMMTSHLRQQHMMRQAELNPSHICLLYTSSLVDGKYKILNEVGHGGMSIVYLAMNEKANKQWAIKEVRKDGVKDFEVVKQSLVAETDMLKKLSHPCLPDIVDVIEDDDRFLIVMDYIQGNSLSKALDEFGEMCIRDRDKLYISTYMLEMFSYSTMDNEGRYRMLKKSGYDMSSLCKSNYETAYNTMNDKWNSEEIKDNYNSNKT